MQKKIEEVFKVSGTPTYTFVQPIEYQQLLVALRTAGRGVVIEGPSGIGKTTAVNNALAELGLSGSALKLSARKKEDVKLISELPSLSPLARISQCAVKGVLFPAGASPARQLSLQPEALEAVQGGNELD